MQYRDFTAEITALEKQAVDSALARTWEKMVDVTDNFAGFTPEQKAKIEAAFERHRARAEAVLAEVLR
jgi:hypothetical protein